MNIVVLSCASCFGFGPHDMKTHVLKGDCLIRVLRHSILKARLPECARGKTEQGLKWEVLELITITSSYHLSS